MPYIRQLPSGLWQATVRHPSGRRITETDELKRVVKNWARDEEAKYARGDVRDPRAGHITLGEWHERWIRARGIEPTTRDKLDSVWRTHCLPQWATWPMDSVTVMEAQEWVRVLERKRRARHKGVPVEDGKDSPELAATTVHAAVHLMSSLYVSAMRERPPVVLGNPFKGLDLPRIPPSPIDFYTHEEVSALLDVLDPQWALYVEMGTWMGLRPGELSGLAGKRIDWFRANVQVTQVMTRTGLRDYPKSRKSHRIVPMSRRDMTTDCAALLAGRANGGDGLIFARPMGGPVDDTWFRHRIWVPAIKASGIRPLPPRAMRHTAASWLVMDGVPLYDVQALLGHESFATTQRYAHLAPDAHSRVVDSWQRRRGETA